MTHSSVVTLQQLEYLLAIEGQKTWAAAAKSIGVSGSALSQAMANLERSLGLELFERDGRRRQLTETGVHATDHARRVLAAVTDLERWALAARSGRAGQVRIGMIDLAAVHYFPEVLAEFRRDVPDVELRLTIASSSVLVAGLRAGELDAAIVVTPPSTVPDISIQPLLKDELAIYGPSEGRGNPSPTPLNPEDPATWGPWVTFPADSHTRHLIARALRRAGASFEVEADSNQPEVLRQLVNLGLGLTVLPVLQAESGPRPLKRLQTSPLLSRDLVIALRQSALPPPVTQSLLDRLSASRPAQVDSGSD